MNPNNEPTIDRAERMQKLVSAMHVHFETLTAQRLTLSYQRMQAWYELIRREYTIADVALVIRWIKSQMGKPGSGFSAQSLQFSRLIQDADLFEDRLNMAKQAAGRRIERPTTEIVEQSLPGGAIRQAEVPTRQKEPQRITGEEALAALHAAYKRNPTE